MCFVGILTVLVALPALAQQGPGGRGARRGERDTRGPHGMGRGERGPMQMLERLPEQLDLSMQQRQQFDDIMRDFRVRWADQTPDRDALRELNREYRQARDAGDTQRAEELRKQMREMARNRGGMVSEFLDAVDGILNEQQRERLNEMRERLERRGPRGQGLRELMRELPDALNLTEEQRAFLDGLLAEERERVGQLREQFAKLRPLFQELREAMQNRDEARVAEIEAEIERLRPERPDPLALAEKLKEVLTDEQKQQLDQLVAERAPDRRDGPPGARQRNTDVRGLFRCAMRLKLTEEQRGLLSDLRREAMRESRAVRGDREKLTALEEATKTKILEMLDASQTEQFNELLTRGTGYERPRGRERGRLPGGRHPRGRSQTESDES
jgi:Spy/CpxP family protein refolding chaperone